MASKSIRDIETILAAREQQLEEISRTYDALAADVAALRRTRELLLEMEQQIPPDEVPAAKAVRNEMVEILKAHGRPLHYGEIYERLLQRGVEVAGKDPKRNVGAHLSIDDRFEKRGGGEWALASWSKPEDQAPPAPVRGIRLSDLVAHLDQSQGDAEIESESEDDPVEEDTEPTREELEAIQRRNWRPEASEEYRERVRDGLVRAQAPQEVARGWSFDNDDPPF